MKSSGIVFPGSNCDRDVAVELEKLQYTNMFCMFFALLLYLVFFIFINK